MQSDFHPAGQSATESDTAYLDQNGHAQLRKSIVGFLDILGFSSAIESTMEQADAQLLVNRIRAAIDDSKQYVRKNLGQDSALTANPWAVKFFSDNLVVGYPFEGTPVSAETAARFIIRASQRYQLRMVLNGFFLRGALTQGPICLTDDIIFGSALLECYHLESKASIVPRVILTEPLKQLVGKSVREQAEHGSADDADSICRDIDGWWFVSYLEATRDGEAIDWDLVERHKQAILESLQGLTRHDVLPKYGWACRYHNMFCHWHRDVPGYSDRFRIDRVDESSQICRLGDAPPT